MSAMSFYRVIIVGCASVASLLVGGCGEDEQRGGKFNVKASVDHYAGPSPLITRFSATSKAASGDVIYRWRFDDGTISARRGVTHKFARAGYYQVILDARDEAGNNDRETFLLGAWPPKLWAHAQTTAMTPNFARAAQRGQTRRT